jgi:hypothetical protein
VVGRERLQRAHRLAVVAELPVVVILDHHAAPVGRLAAAPGMQRHAQRELVRRGQQHRVRPGSPADDGAHAVDRQRPQAQALPGRDVAVGLVAVCLDREGGRARRAQRAADASQAVREARADDDVRRIGGHAPRPGQVVGQGGSQLRHPSRIRVPEQVIGGIGEDLAGRGEPGAARERRQVGRSGAQVVAGHRLLGPGRDRRAGRGRPVRGDRGPRPGPGGQPSLGDQLAVDLGDRIAGDAQVRGQCARRRELRTRTEAAGPDSVAQRAFQPGPHPGPAKVEVQVHSAHEAFGPCFFHRSGPYLGPLWPIAWVS